MLLVSLVIAVCLFAMVYAAASAVTGRDALGLPDTIEKIDPVPAAVRVPSQTSVFVDLLPGYEGVLIVDGLELPTVNIEDLQDVANKPGQQITLPPTTIYEPGNATLTFEPSDDALITGFGTGRHEATVVFWKIDESRAQSSSFRWDFYVV